MKFNKKIIVVLLFIIGIYIFIMIMEKLKVRETILTILKIILPYLVLNFSFYHSLY